MYELKELNYPYNALEPYIGTRTVTIHHNEIEKGYLNRLNTVLKKENFNYKYDLINLINNIDKFNIENRDDILYNAGGVLNHELYWEIMSPNNNIYPVGRIKEAIDREYGSYQNFKNKFKEVASKLVGSGWTFLVINKENQLEIINTSNEETPYLYGLTPIIALDLWEHAYYLDYQNNRSNYINNFFSIIDFVKVNELYEKNIKK